MLIQQRKLSGFTLIELIVVIILVSIVSVVAATRLLNRSGFSVIAAQEQAIAITQQIQLGECNPILARSASSIVATNWQLKRDVLALYTVAT